MKIFHCLAGLVASVLAMDISLTPNAVTITDSNRLSAAIQVKLNRAPTQNVKVFLETSTLQLSNCTLLFTPQNFNQPQTVRLMPAPYFPAPNVDPKRPAETISAHIAPDGALPQKSIQTATVKYQTHAGATCTSYGDPHFTTFDGRTYDFMGRGDYYLVKSPRLEIQTRQTQYYGGSATINTQVVVRFQKTVFVFTSGLLVKGQPTLKLQKLTQFKDDRIHILSVNEQSYTVTFFDGSSIKIVVSDPSQKYFNVAVNLSGYFFNDGVSGLCGNFNGKREDDVLNPEDFKVPQPSNYLVNGPNVQTPDFTHTQAAPQGAGICSLPPAIVNPPVVTPNYGPPPMPGYTTVSLGNVAPFAPLQAVQQVVAVARNVSAVLVTKAEAETHCASALALPDCVNIVESDPFVKSCVGDAMSSGSLNSVEATRVTYRLLCDTRAKSMVSIGSVAAKTRATAAQAALKCANNCSGRGTCMESGCLCNAGFTGTGCGTSIVTKCRK